MSAAKKYWGGQALAGIGLAALFGILAGTSGGDWKYIAAASVCGVIGVVSGIIFFASK
jgi:hypothetical protein